VADPLTPSQDATHEIDYYGLQHDTPVDHGTTHLSVVDQWGGAASITSTVSELALTPRSQSHLQLCHRSQPLMRRITRSTSFGGVTSWTRRRV
jgi:hypothetical protein